MFTQMVQAVQCDGVADESSFSAVELIGSGSTPSLYPVSDFAQSAIATAVAEICTLRKWVWNLDSNASVDRVLASAWCERSVYPDGWKSPSQWDEFAGDYRCDDGWIRLHTNAPEHRKAALGVLGEPATRAEAIEQVANWQTCDLEGAVVGKGGAAAVMMSVDQWTNHPQGKAIQQEPVVAWSHKAAVSASEASLNLNTPARPLQGLRVLDLTRVLAGPVCTRFLASLGAEVLRIDPPQWDEEGLAPEVTLGKRCAGLDLKQVSDRKTFELLIKRAHVIVHGYRRDALDTLGFGDQARAVLNPDLIDVALNAYGWSGPWSYRRGFDSLVQMSSGIADAGMRNAKAAEPVPLPFQALDHVTGYLMAASVIHAVTRRVCDAQILCARLSLARQAHLLQTLSGLAIEQKMNTPLPSSHNARMPAISAAHFADGVEHTPWGPLTRLRLPYVVDGVNTRFDEPVCRLRSQPARWAN